MELALGKGPGGPPARAAGGPSSRVRDPEVSLLEDVLEGIHDRAVAGGARPQWPAARIGFLPSVRALIRRFAWTTGIGVDLREGPTPALSGDVETALYWVVREALDNLERDARATGVVVMIRRLKSVVELVIRDDGVGLVARQGPGGRTSPHFGIRAMTRCLEQVGGRLEIDRAKPRGLLIRATVPADGAAS